MKTDKHFQELFENRVEYLLKGKSLEPDVDISLEQEAALENMLELVAQSRQAPNFTLSLEKRQALTSDLKARLQAKSRLTILPPLPGNILALEPRRNVSNSQPRRLNRFHGLQLVLVAASVVMTMGLLVWLAFSEQPGNNLAAPNTSIPAATLETINATIEITTDVPETAVTEDVTTTVAPTQQVTSVATTTLVQAPAKMQNTTAQVPVVTPNPSATTELEKQTLTPTVAVSTASATAKSETTVAPTRTPTVAKTVTTVAPTVKTPDATSTPATTHAEENKTTLTPVPSATHDNNKESDQNKD